MKIFIIEDEPAIREELVQLLQKYGYQCDSSDDFHHIVQAALSSGANLMRSIPFLTSRLFPIWA